MEFVITPEYDKKTVKDFLYREINPSGKLLSFVKNKENGITVNGIRVTVRYMLSCGDILGFNYDDYDGCGNYGDYDENNNRKNPRGFVTENHELLKLVDIIYEDEYMLAVNKPYNMPSHPSINHYGDTLANAIMAYFSKTRLKSFFRAVNRLDKNTSGIVLIAKDKMISARLNNAMKHGEIRKTYIAVIAGNLAEISLEEITVLNNKLSEINGSFGYDAKTGTGKITAPIKREQDSIIKRICASDGDYSETDFKLLKSNKDMSVVEVYPKTGRTHQIRLHFHATGFPLIGDDLYFTEKSREISSKYNITRHTLHAESLEFAHPAKIGGNINIIKIICRVCEDMESIISMIK